MIKFKPKKIKDLRNILERKKMPSIDEMFEYGDKLNQNKRYSTKNVIKLSHSLRYEE